MLAWPSRGLRLRIPEPDQVVGGRDEEEVPLDAISATVAQLAQVPDRLHPAEDLFDALAHPLTHSVPGMPRRAAIDCWRSLKTDQPDAVLLTEN